MSDLYNGNIRRGRCEISVVESRETQLHAVLQTLIELMPRYM